MQFSEAVSVLLVDDRADKLLALQSMLEPLHYRIHTVNSGKEALRALLKERFHLVILDVNMPGLDGFETARLIRERESLAELPIIFVSAFDATADDMEKGYALGAVDYIQTPVRAAVLQARVSTFVTLRIRTEELQKANAHLKEVNEQMSAFLYTVSHDLRSPLRSINSFSKILVEECQECLQAEHLDLLKRVAWSGLRMDRLLDDLLSYSQLAHSELHAESVDTGAILEGVLAELRPHLIQRGATVQIGAALPTVRGNPTLLGQVLQNLVDNASKFVLPGNQS